MLQRLRDRLRQQEKVRVAFAHDCCDREAIAHVATTGGIKREDVQNLVITAVKNRFGRVNMLSEPIEWLNDNGSCFVARDTASLPARSAWNLAQHRCEARNRRA